MRRFSPLPAILVPALVAVFGLVSGPAEAAFNVCNQTSLKTHVALGRFDGTQWTSIGWWTINPRACAGLLTGPLEARYYYLYASDGAAGSWEGRTHFCVAPNSRFTIAGRGNCAGRGYDQRGFLEVDTGNAPDWTQTLTN